MTRPEKDRLCAHAACPCPADPGSLYCSPECETTSDAHDTPCQCNHAVCRQAQRTRQRPDGQKGVSGSYDPQKSAQDRDKPLLDDWGKADKH
jgi:hypothetical protein